MRLRSFIAPTMQEAIAIIRKEMGDDAVIVSSHESRSGVEVTAAVDVAPVEKPAAGPLCLENDLESRLKARLRSEQQSEDEPETASSDDFYPDDDTKARFDPERLREALAFHSAPAKMQEALVRTACSLNTDDAVMALAGAIDTRFNFRPIPDIPDRPLILIGPPGGGKTVTAAKLAARIAIAGSPVEFITADAHRAGGIQQLRVFSDLMGQHLRVVDGPEELGSVMATRNRDIPCIIDTPAANPYDLGEVDQIQSLISASAAEVVLVLGAGGDPQELLEWGRTFAHLGVSRMIATKLDATRRLGGLLALLEAGGLTLSHVSITPYIARGLTMVNPVSLARLMLDSVELPEMTLPEPAFDTDEAVSRLEQMLDRADNSEITGGTPAAANAQSK